LVREQLKTVTELYKNFAKFSKSEILHFRKLEQQRKAPKHYEASRPVRYNDSKHHNYLKHVNNINSDGYKTLKTGKRILGHSHKKRVKGLSTIEQASTTKEEACQPRAEVTVEAHSSHHTTCTTTMISTTTQKTAQYSSTPKERWSKTTTNLGHNPPQER
jgi:hypothetical protein